MSPRKRRAQRDSSNAVSNRIVTAALYPLTPREAEVTGWIAAGKRNNEIGAILGCSPRTVQKHVQNILDKLDLENRTAICTWCHEQHREVERLARDNWKK